MAVLIEEGEFVFSGATELKPFSRGAFVGDMKAVLNKTNTTTALICASETGLAYYVTEQDLLKFIEENPGLYIYFLNRRFLE